MNAHQRVVLLTVLPKERRARHPYQLCVMVALVALSASQLIVGPVPVAAITSLAQGQQDMLNWYALFGGLAGVLAAIIPERTIRFRCRRRHEFDATWCRLWVEMGCQALLCFVWISYLVTVSVKVPLAAGLTLGSGLALGLAAAAAWRAIQILWTVKRAVLDPPCDSGIIGARELPELPE